MQEQCPYKQRGYADRRAYLGSLAIKYDISFNQVSNLASYLGPDNDFDDLILELEDFACFL